MARVSCRQLRFYDQLGLLRPGSVDARTGYRYYHASQLHRLNQILVLKELGLSLEQIAKVIDDALSAEQLRAMLLVRRSELAQEIAEQTARLGRIESRIAELDESRDAVDGVVVREEPGFVLASVRQAVGSFDEARQRILALWAEFPEQVAGVARGRLVAIAHSAEFEPDAIDLELGFALGPPPERGVSWPERIALPGGGHATLRQVAPVEHLAACVRVGPPEQAHATTGSIARHIERHGYVLAGPNREVFLRGPSQGRMDEVVVEMQFPVRPRASPPPEASPSTEG